MQSRHRRYSLVGSAVQATASTIQSEPTRLPQAAWLLPSLQACAVGNGFPCLERLRIGSTIGMWSLVAAGDASRTNSQ